MRDRPLPFVLDPRRLDSHYPCPLPPICEIAGLNDDDCEDCPFCLCVMDLSCEEHGGNALSSRLGALARRLSIEYADVKEPLRTRDIQDKIEGWLERVAVPECRVIVRDGPADQREDAKRIVDIVEGKWRTVL